MLLITVFIIQIINNTLDPDPTPRRTQGKFLDRNRVRKHGTAKHDCAWMAQDDLLVDLPGSVRLKSKI